MIDLNDLRVFERVAALRSFSAAARALGLPKSSVTRSVQRLEARLAMPLMQRTTREVTLTEAGLALSERCKALLGQVDDAVEHVSSLGAEPRGHLRVSAGIGFGINVLADLLPRFALRYPKITILLDLSSQTVDLINDRIDVAIRMGPLPDSSVVARRLGVLHRYLCASPDYLARRGIPEVIADLRNHDLVEFPNSDGRGVAWTFRKADCTVEHRQDPRFTVNCALTIQRLLLNGAGIGVSSGYLCVPEIAAGKMVRLFEDWSLPSVPVHAVFPSHRERSSAVRVFLDFLRETCWDGHQWQFDPLALRSTSRGGCSEAGQR
ncbi:LysR family transcriptional regulator [Roseomonas mucosa]